MYLPLNDLKMHVKIEGEGHPLLVLHGFTGSSVTWAPFFLSWQRSYQVIAPDLIGHGQTDSPKRTERYTMNRAVEDLVSLLDKLGIAKTRLLGYSMGGRLGLAFAASYPERVASLLLESSSPGLETETERLQRVKRDEALADQIVQDGIEAFVEKWENVPLFSTQSDEIKASLREQRLQNRRGGLAGS
ncbi:MAG TPA: alpha/beta fold hydrolase, partial [Bacillales bacterium]|nr:alpha/beta fold hydrolase [Bacillales bacterium]